MQDVALLAVHVVEQSDTCSAVRIVFDRGNTLAWSALESGIVQKVQAYIAPKIFGGASSKTPVGGTGFPSPDKALRLKNMTMTRLGQDLLLEGDIEGKEEAERCSQD